MNMYRRINVTLPDETLRLLEQFAPKGDRSSFIDEAIHYFIGQKQKQQLRQLLKEGAVRHAERDRNLCEDWVGLEEEAWQHDAKL
jgi:CopG family transcriptional regulator/antitoxin EndoAI